MAGSWDSAKGQVRNHFFRLSTAGATLAAYVYCWLNAPEWLTWWKRSTTRLIEIGCGLLPYPWGDRIETTIGDFGLWVQITLAILAVRLLAWLVIAGVRRLWSARNSYRSTSQGLPAQEQGDI